MTEKKPEWFEISDSDNSKFPKPITKKLPLIFAVMAVGIVGVGAVVAQTAEESPAIAETPVASQTVAPTSTPTLTPKVVVTPNKPAISNPPRNREDEGFDPEGRESGDHGRYGDDD